MQVTICGPNLRDQSKGTFHVHAAGCGDLVRHARREPEYSNGWTVEVSSRREIVEAIYSDHMDEERGEIEHYKSHPDDAARMGRTPEMLAQGVQWTDYDDLHVFPCVDLPDEPAAPEHDERNWIERESGGTIGSL